MQSLNQTAASISSARGASCDKTSHHVSPEPFVELCLLFLPDCALSDQFENTTYNKVTRRLIPFLVLCYVVSYLDRINVGFAKLQMLGDLHFSETVFGLGSGIFFIGYFFFEVPSNIILHKCWSAGLDRPDHGYLQGNRFWHGYAVRYERPCSFRACGFFSGWPRPVFSRASSSTSLTGIPRTAAQKWLRRSWWPFRCREFLEGRFPDSSCNIWAGNPVGPAGSGCSCWKQSLRYSSAQPACFISTVGSALRQAADGGRKKGPRTEYRRGTQPKSRTRFFAACVSGSQSVADVLDFLFLRDRAVRPHLRMPSFIKTAGIKTVFNVGLVTAIPYLATAVHDGSPGRKLRDWRRERRWHLGLMVRGRWAPWL